MQETIAQASIGRFRELFAACHFAEALALAETDGFADTMDAEISIDLAVCLEAAQRYDDAANQLRRDFHKISGTISDLDRFNFLRGFAYYRSLATLEKSRRRITLHRGFGKPILNALRVSMVKDEDDIIFPNLENSYRAGLRHFAIADNGSTDATRSEIERFRRLRADAVVFVVDDPVVGYYQDAKTLGLLRLGRTILAGAGFATDWIFPVDADEFIESFAPSIDLHDVLGRADAEGRNLLMFFLCNASSTAPIERLAPDADLGRSFPVVSEFRGQAKAKSMFRYSDAARPWMGNHFVDHCVSSIEEVAAAAEGGLLMLHYPMRSLAQVAKKVVNGGIALDAAPGRETSCAHWRRNFAAFRVGGPAEFETILTRFNGNNARRSRLDVRFGPSE